MSIFDVAFDLMAETRAAGTLLRYEPVPMLSMPWEGPAQWRVGVDTWESIRAEARLRNGLTAPSLAHGVILFGYPLVVDEFAPPSLLILEPMPA